MISSKPPKNQNQGLQRSPARKPQKAHMSVDDGFPKKKDMLQIPLATPPMNDFDNGLYYGDIGESQLDTYGDGESIKVAMRVRPMNSMELRRGDENCCRVLNDTTCQITNK